MCYSKEVSLVAGTAMVAMSAYTWQRFVHAPRKRAAVDPVARRAVELRPVFESVLAAHLCIAGHQFIEFLAIWTGNSWVYRIGLTMSISCLIFLFQAIERLTSSRYGARFFLPIVALVGLEMTTRTMTFENEHFWVRGHAHALWGVVWMTSFIYWLLCIGDARRRTTSAANRRLLRYFAFGVLGATYFVSMAYTYLAAMARDGGAVGWLWKCAGAEELNKDHSIVMDTPSIWCVFALAQVFCLPPLFAALARSYEPETPRQGGESIVGSRVRLALLALAISGAMYASYPLFHLISTKMVTK